MGFTMPSINGDNRVLVNEYGLSLIYSVTDEAEVEEPSMKMVRKTYIYLIGVLHNFH